MSARFFPYHPRRWRRWVGAAVALMVALAGWAMTAFARSGDVKVAVRAGMAVGLGLALARLFQRLGPRAGWGVSVDDQGVTVARVTRGEVRVRWSQVRDVLLGGRDRDVYALRLEDDRQVLVPAHLFPDEAAFLEFLAAANAAREAGRA